MPTQPVRMRDVVAANPKVFGYLIGFALAALYFRLVLHVSGIWPWTGF